MSKAKILTQKIAEQFLADEDSVELWEFTSIEDAAAQALAQHKGDLYLSGLTSLGDAAAQALAQYEGTLSLNGLKKLSDAAAQALAQHRGEYLSLDGLTSLSDAAAQALAQNKGDLSLNGLKSLSDSPGHVALARKLAQHKRDLYLDGLTSLSDAAAQALAQRKRRLSLGGLTSLSAAAAQALAQHKGGLYLEGLKSLSDAAAQALAQHRGGYLFLDGLKSLSDAAAQGLAQHKGDLDLGGLTSLSDAVAQALAQHKGGLYLEGLKSLSDAAAKSLSRLKGEIYLWGLRVLDDSPAHVALASKLGAQQTCDLGELQELSDAAALALAKRSGGKSFSIGVRSLSDSPAKCALANSIAMLPAKTWVRMPRLIEMSDDFAAALGRRNGWLSIESLKKMSPAAAMSLSGLETLDIHYKGKELIRAAKKKSRKGPAKTKVVKLPLGCPASVLEWMQGSLVVAEVALDKLEAMVKKTKIDHIPVAVNYKSNWSFVYGIPCLAPPDGYDDVAECVSSELGVKAVTLWYDDTSGLFGYTCYDAGKKIESYLDSTAVEGEVVFESKWTSESPSVVSESDGSEMDVSFISKRFKAIGIGLPPSV